MSTYHPVFGTDPFTARDAACVGWSPDDVRGFARDGPVRRVLLGVYVDATVPDDLRLRARALVKVVPAGWVVCLRTAGWLLTADVLPVGAHRAIPPVDLMAPSASPPPRRTGCRGRTGPLAKVFDALRQLLARPDMGYRRERKALEFDGDQFHRTAAQLRHDLTRRESVEREGWAVSVVTTEQVLGRGLAFERVVSELLGAAPRLTRHHPKYGGWDIGEPSWPPDGRVRRRAVPAGA